MRRLGIKGYIVVIVIPWDLLLICFIIQRTNSDYFPSHARKLPRLYLNLFKHMQPKPNLGYIILAL